MTITPDRLQQRLDYIAFRRAGGSLKPHMDAQREESRNETEKQVNTLRQKLLGKQEESRTTINSLVADLETTDIVEPAEMQLTNLRTTLSEVKKTQEKLKEVNTTAEQEIRRTTDQRVELQNMLGNLRQTLKSRKNQILPYQEQINQSGGNACNEIAGISPINRKQVGE